jgi:hypothetical protein
VLADAAWVIGVLHASDLLWSIEHPAVGHIPFRP